MTRGNIFPPFQSCDKSFKIEKFFKLIFDFELLFFLTYIVYEGISRIWDLYSSII